MQNDIIFIEDPDFIPTKHFKNNKFCINGVISKKKCKMPCIYFDTIYCTCVCYTEKQEKLVLKYLKEVTNNAE